MTIAISCNCGKKLQVKEELAGRNIRCPACQAILSTPAKEADTPEPAPASRRSAKAQAAPPPLPAHTGPSLRSRQIVLRCIVLILGLAGSGVAGVLGFKAYSNTHDPDQAATVELTRARIKVMEQASPSNPVLAEARDEVVRFERNSRVCYFLLAAALLGSGGAILAFRRRRMIAAPLLLVPAAGSGVIAVQTLVLTAPLILAGLLSLMIKPAPAPS